VNQEQPATRVAELVGGPDNVTSVTTCATRLRFVLKNPDTARLKEFGEFEGVHPSPQERGADAGRHRHRRG
jgi:phosphotransferase system IIB component